VRGGPELRPALGHRLGSVLQRLQAPFELTQLAAQQVGLAAAQPHRGIEPLGVVAVALLAREQGAALVAQMADGLEHRQQALDDDILHEMAGGRIILQQARDLADPGGQLTQALELLAVAGIQLFGLAGAAGCCRQRLQDLADRLPMRCQIELGC